MDQETNQKPCMTSIYIATIAALLYLANYLIPDYPFFTRLFFQRPLQWLGLIIGMTASYPLYCFLLLEDGQMRRARTLTRAFYVLCVFAAFCSRIVLPVLNLNFSSPISFYNIIRVLLSLTLFLMAGGLSPLKRLMTAAVALWLTVMPIYLSVSHQRNLFIFTFGLPLALSIAYIYYKTEVKKA